LAKYKVYAKGVDGKIIKDSRQEFNSPNSADIYIRVSGNAVGNKKVVNWFVNGRIRKGSNK